MRKSMIAIMALALLVGISGFAEAKMPKQEAKKTESKAVAAHQNQKKWKKDARKEATDKSKSANDLVNGAKIS